MLRLLLAGLNRLWNLNIPIEELQVLGAELGSDVPFCVSGGTALATRAWREAGAYRRRRRNVGSILAKPPINVSTSDIYGKLNAREIKRHPSTEGVLKAIKDKQFDQSLRQSG